MSLADVRALWQRTEVDRWITYVSCWRMDRSEDERAWRDYRASVALRTTVGKLKLALFPELRAELDHPTKFGMVQYIDRLVDQIAPQRRSYPLTTKSHAYLWEKELRVVWRYDGWFDEVAHQLFLEGVAEPRTAIAIGQPLVGYDYIDEVVAGPSTTAHDINEIRTMIRSFNEKRPVRKSIFGAGR